MTFLTLQNLLMRQVFTCVFGDYTEASTYEMLQEATE